MEGSSVGSGDATLLQRRVLFLLIYSKPEETARTVMGILQNILLRCSFVVGGGDVSSESGPRQHLFAWSPTWTLTLSCVFDISLIKTGTVRGYRESSAVKSTCFSCRGSGSTPSTHIRQRRVSKLQHHVIQGRLWPLWTGHTSGAQICTQAKTHKNKRRKTHSWEPPSNAFFPGK